MIWIGRLLITIGLGAFIAAVWFPGFIWQCFFTGAILFATGAAILGNNREEA